MPDVYPGTALTLYKSIKKGTCFVLMPFASQFDQIWEEIRQTVQSEELNILCNRADDFRDPNILESILKGIAQSEFIIADLTNASPNVFYEVGIAHCTKKPHQVILISQDIKFVPFDLRHLRCIIYDTSKTGILELKRNLADTLSQNSNNVLRIRIYEGKKFKLDKKFVGKDRDLFSVYFECVHLSDHAAKIVINFERFSLDKTGVPNSQFMLVATDIEDQKIDNIPWQLSLIKSDGQAALLQMEKMF